MEDDRQRSFAEALLNPRLGLNERLRRLNRLIDWRPVERLIDRSPARPPGRGRYSPLSMLKAAYLQSLYGLSDPGLEDALLDRLSFRRFCGFSLEGTTPDETTIWRFRKRAGPLIAEAIAEIDGQLSAKGLILRKGTLREARLTAAPRRRNKPDPGEEA
jgi:transposase